jgi:anti-sigma factor RsiW
MSEHILEWLAAYHDDQLAPHKRRRVEDHLRDCPSCRAELQALDGLSALLKHDPLPAHTPPERFAAQVQLLLPRATPARDRLPRWVLGLPLALAVAWAFLQAALLVAWLALLAAPLLPAEAAGWLAPDDAFEAAVALPALNLLLLAGAAALWLAWLALWQTWQRHRRSLALAQ